MACSAIGCDGCSRDSLRISTRLVGYKHYEFLACPLTHYRPDAISSIVESMQPMSRTQPATYRLSRALLALLHVVKELSTARLQRSRQQLQTAAPSITAVLFSVYTSCVHQWMSFLHHGGDDEGGAVDSMEQSLLALRVLRRLVVQYDFPNRHQDLQEVWKIVNEHFGEMLGLLSPDKASLLHAAPRTAIELHLIQISKLHLNMVKGHPAAFALLPDSIGLARAYWSLARQMSQTYGLRSENMAATIGTDGDAGDEVPFQEKLTLKGLLILRAIDKMVFNPIQTFKYQQAEDKEEKKNARERMRDQLLTEEFAKEIMEVMVTRFFVFTSRDLKQWEEEPDEWEKTQEDMGEDWEFSIRMCAEKLFLDLIINYKEALIPSLLNVLQNAGMRDKDKTLLCCAKFFLQEFKIQIMYLARTPFTLRLVLQLPSLNKDLILQLFCSILWFQKFRYANLDATFSVGELRLSLANGCL